MCNKAVSLIKKITVGVGNVRKICRIVLINGTLEVLTAQFIRRDVNIGEGEEGLIIIQFTPSTM